MKYSANGMILITIFTGSQSLWRNRLHDFILPFRKDGKEFIYNFILLNFIKFYKKKKAETSCNSNSHHIPL
jgi:hypothetical protein